MEDTETRTSSGSAGAEIASVVAASQGAVYVLTGLWPILHLRSFMAVTGPKADGWLVKTMGGLIAAVGAALCVSATTRMTRSTKALGVLAACALGGADVWYAGKGRISRVYLLDAVLEAAIVAGWTASMGPLRPEKLVEKAAKRYVRGKSPG